MYIKMSHLSLIFLPCNIAWIKATFYFLGIFLNICKNPFLLYLTRGKEKKAAFRNKKMLRPKVNKGVQCSVATKPKEDNSVLES